MISHASTDFVCIAQRNPDIMDPHIFPHTYIEKRNGVIDMIHVPLPGWYTWLPAPMFSHSR